MVRLLHRQIFRENVNLFLLSLACLLGIILLGRMLQLRELLLGQDIGLFDLATLFIYLSPFFLFLLTPIACMLSVFLTFLRMSTDRELVALKSNGISLYQLMPAPFLFCVCCTLFALFISHFGMSWGMEHFRSKILDMIRTRTRLAVQAGIFNEEFPGLTFYAHKVDEETGALEFVFVQDERQEGITVNIVADEAKVITDPKEGRLVLSFTNGRIYRRTGERLEVLQFGSYVIRLPLGNLFGNWEVDERKPNELSVAELKLLAAHPGSMADVERASSDKVLTELEKRYSLPVGCLVLGLFAMPAACMFTGLRRQYGLVLSLGMFMVYYTLFSLGVSMGETGTLNPRIGLWLSNGVFFVVGAAFMRLASRERNARWVLRLGVMLRRRRGASA